MTTPAVIVDVDGTLCDVSGIRHYVAPQRRKRDFHTFHKASAFCPPILGTLDWVEQHRRDDKAIIVVTARERRWEHLTRIWLHKHNVAFDALLMRPNGDYRPDQMIKSQILADVRAAGFDVIAAIDDNPSIVALWEANSIPTTIVPGWDDPITMP